jgi:hypothetical protein
MTVTSLAICLLGLASIPLSQAQFGAAGGGSASDPVATLLSSGNALRQCYSFSGQMNNLENPKWGAVGEILLRPEGSSYNNNDWHQFRDGPNPRSISNILSHETCAEASRNAEPCLTDWFWLHGQWTDHDLTMVPTFTKNESPDTELSINVPPTDPFLAGRTLPLTRSLVEPESPTPNEQINLTTSYLDQSQVYGSSVERADTIRTFRNGMLKATLDGFMPVMSALSNMGMSSVPTFEELGSPVKDQFLCADMRCNQHAPMAVFQSMWIREHNRIALALANSNHPAYNTDEAIYQAARACVIAMNQAITYQEFLPLLLGKFNLPPYAGYNPRLRPTVSNAFSTAGYRTLHSMVGCDFKEMTGTGQTLRSVSFATSYFDSTWIRNLPAQPNRGNREANAYQTIMHSLGLNPSTHFDHKVAPILRSVVFGGATQVNGFRRPDVAFDVVSSDIQRGRDHGLLTYREMRNKLGWKDIRQMEDISLSLEKVNILKSIYGENVDHIDLMVGLMTEDSLDGALTGPVTTSIIQDQFRRVRDGDRCWYENQFQGQLLQILRSTKLKHVVERNFNNPNNPFASEVVQGTQPVRTPAPSTTPRTTTGRPVPGVTPTANVGTAPSTVAIPVLPVNIPASVSTLSITPEHLQSNLLNPIVTLQDVTEEKIVTGENDQDNFDHLDIAACVEGTECYERHINKKNHKRHGGEGKKKGKKTRSGGRRVERFEPEEECSEEEQDGVRRYRRSDSKYHDADRTRGGLYVVDSTIERAEYEKDPEGHAHRRYRNGQSRFDNGRGTRPAQAFDDIVGWECYGETCFPVALESEPVIADDPEVIEFIREFRERKRAQQHIDETTRPGTAVITRDEKAHRENEMVSELVDTLDNAGLAHRAATLTNQSTQFIRQNGFNTLLFSQPNTMATLANHQNNHFTTMQVRPGTVPSRTTNRVPLTNGRVALSPMDGVLQNDQRASLASQVTPAQTSENIFLTPSCRSRV